MTTTGAKPALDSAQMLVEIHGSVEVLRERTKGLTELTDTVARLKQVVGINGNDGELRQIKNTLDEFIRKNDDEHKVLHGRITDDRVRSAGLRGQWKGLLIAVSALYGLFELLSVGASALTSYLAKR